MGIMYKDNKMNKKYGYREILQYFILKSFLKEKDGN